jgi:hypothetical protein
MSKLAAAIRNHFVVVPHIEAKALFLRSPRQILAPTIDLLPGAVSGISVAVNSPTTRPPCGGNWCCCTVSEGG